MENTAKYEFTGEIRKVNVKGIEYEVKRIKALKDFQPPTMLDEVNIGDYGGWIESENNLSQDGLCWVDEEAVVIGNAIVKDNAYVCGKALIRDNAVICDKATVDENAIVGGESLICENACIVGNAEVYGYITVKGNAEINNFVTLVNLDQSNKAVIDGNLFIDTPLFKK